MGDCSRALVTTPLGPINSLRLLEHQVMANHGSEAAAWPHCADFATVRAQDLQGAQLGPLKKPWLNGFRNTASPLTLHFLSTRSQSSTAQISDTVFFTWYVHLCLPKPLETILKSAFHIFNQKASSVEEFVQNFHYPLSPSLSSPLFFFLHSFMFPCLFPTCSHTS